MPDWLDWNIQAISFGEAVFRVFAAAALGSLIGLDREFKDKPIGLRAYMLVSVGAASFAMISYELAYIAAESGDIGNADASRLIQGLLGALGFLGAGAIIQSENKVIGTATAAAIWTVGAIGAAIGFGLYGYAVLATTAAFIILSVIGYVRARTKPDMDGEFLTKEEEKKSGKSD